MTTFAETLKSVARLLSEARRGASQDLIAAEAERIVSAAGHRTSAKPLSRMELYTRASEEAPAELTIIATRMAHERAAGSPLQYVTGSQAFLEHEYEVTRDVLIPRPETEVLVTEAFRVLSRGGEPKLGLEIGVGSGIISIELLSRFPTVEMIATDISIKAIEVARRNAKRILGPGASRLRLTPVDSRNLWGPLARDSSEKPDFLISNPPYLMPNEATEEVRTNEPKEALFPPENPLYFYTLIAEQAAFFLKEGGGVFLELPHERATRIQEIFTEAGWSATLIKDLTGRDRVLIAREKFP